MFVRRGAVRSQAESVYIEYSVHNTYQVERRTDYSTALYRTVVTDGEASGRQRGALIAPGTVFPGPRSHFRELTNLRVDLVNRWCWCWAR